jgi:hypothetical protein
MADNSTCFGALYKSSDISLRDCHLHIETIGQEALAFGGYSEDTHIMLSDSDTKVDVRSALGKETFAPDENIIIKNSRHRVIVNGSEIKRPVTIDYT